MSVSVAACVFSHRMFQTFAQDHQYFASCHPSSFLGRIQVDRAFVSANSSQRTHPYCSKIFQAVHTHSTRVEGGIHTTGISRVHNVRRRRQDRWQSSRDNSGRRETIVEGITETLKLVISSNCAKVGDGRGAVNSLEPTGALQYLVNEQTPRAC